jgi:hypothetical protein
VKAGSTSIGNFQCGTFCVAIQENHRSSEIGDGNLKCWVSAEAYINMGRMAAAGTDQSEIIVPKCREWRGTF